MSRTDYVIGLGSNLGNRLEYLVSARAGVRALGDVLAVSSLYETRAIGPVQADFLNAAVFLRAIHEPEPLLAALLAVEQQLGRVRRERWGPRSIDLDILWSPGHAFSSKELQIPHVELRNRAFALRPLLDVAPDARDPRTGESYRDLLQALPASDARRIPGTEIGNWGAP